MCVCVCVYVCHTYNGTDMGKDKKTKDFASIDRDRTGWLTTQTV